MNAESEPAGSENVERLWRVKVLPPLGSSVRSGITAPRLSRADAVDVFMVTPLHRGVRSPLEQRRPSAPAHLLRGEP